MVSKEHANEYSHLLQLLFEVVGDLGKLGFVDHSGDVHIARLRWHLESLRQYVRLSLALYNSLEMEYWLDGCSRLCDKRRTPRFVSHK